MSEERYEPIRLLVIELYGPVEGAAAFEQIVMRLDAFRERTTPPSRDALFTEQDVILITYGDLLTREGEAPLATLLEFVRTRLADVINTVHILPFYPASSDGGFSVIDYRVVARELGTWKDIEAFEEADIRLMFDAVINHISVQSEWFQGFRSGDPHYRDYFITADPGDPKLAEVTRPRNLPLLTPFETVRGTEYVWTTFSADQVDLNYKNPGTLLDVIDVLLTYVERGAVILRLDAIAYLWKEIGTSCIHLPQTHSVIQLMRLILDAVAPVVTLITETNVPHDENISYFGDGSNEAHMVYNFTLPPLAAHAVITGDASYLQDWAATLTAPSTQTTFFNFTASHDGVGVRPVQGILDDEQLGILIEGTRNTGGKVGLKTNSDGSTSPYELNTTYFDLITNGTASQHVQVKRFLLSQAIMLALAGVPAIYFHSLLGSRNDIEGAARSQHPRDINRERLDVDTVISELETPGTLRHDVFEGYRALLKVRTTEPAFRPVGKQTVLKTDQRVFGVLRTFTDDLILALHNVSPDTVAINIPGAEIPRGPEAWEILFGEPELAVNENAISVTLPPFEVVWLKPKP